MKIRTRIIRVLVLLMFTLVVSHSSVMDGYFPAAVALTAYLSARKPVNALAAVPAVISIAPFLLKGYDPWGDMAAVLVCALFFPAARKVRLKVWQVGMIAACTGIVCMSLSRIATSTVYKISPEKLLVYGALIFAIVIVADVVCSVIGERWPGVLKNTNECESSINDATDRAGSPDKAGTRYTDPGDAGSFDAASRSRDQRSAQMTQLMYAGRYEKEIRIAAFVSAALLIINGAGLSILVWPLILFMAMISLESSSAGAPFLVLATGGIWANLMDQSQWGLMATAVTGAAAAVFVKRFGILARTAAFIVVCWTMGFVESGTVLGVDGYCLFVASALFAVVSWRFRAAVKRLLAAIEGKAADTGESSAVMAAALLKSKSDDMQELAELYATYVDSRSALASQFHMTGQIMDDVRYRISRSQAKGRGFNGAVGTGNPGAPDDPGSIGHLDGLGGSDGPGSIGHLDGLGGSGGLGSSGHSGSLSGPGSSGHPGSPGALGGGSGGRAGTRREKFDVDISASQYAASGTINGDCCGWQDIGDGRTVMVVSDGVGKGKKAAAESLLVTKTLISLLKAGVTPDLALKMINTVMLMKDDEESYATVDLAVIDRRSGKAKFYKIGAAPTLIRHRETVEEVKLSAVPLGIVNGLKIRYREIELKKDDWIIMMSDGVSDGGLAGNTGHDAFIGTLKSTVAKVRSTDPEMMSMMLIDQAADSYIGRERDDLTVLAAHIS